MYEYDEQFYRYINEGSARSARALLPVLLKALPQAPEAVLDVGCGAGAWLSVWKTLGVEVTGLDGDYVQPQQLMVAPDEFVAADLRLEFDLGRRYSIAQSLEVAEHLPAESAAGLVASLCRHADLVLFSAAPPGQGGENHINEQPYDYWRELFLARGYRAYDVVRPALLKDAQVMPWYRYNTLLYVNEEAPGQLLQALAQFELPATAPIPDLSPPLYRLRKGLVRLLPGSASTALARLKKALHVARAGRAAGG